MQRPDFTAVVLKFTTAAAGSAILPQAGFHNHRFAQPKLNVATFAICVENVQKTRADEKFSNEARQNTVGEPAELYPAQTAAG
ncbi:MAG TPA: hypothetical protein VKU82_02725 [Planctomycetaceae bacterium]|nr:hypothetical protein [Planctomycetaceae bacterium]